MLFASPLILLFTNLLIVNVSACYTNVFYQSKDWDFIFNLNDYQYNFAKAAKDNNVTHFILVSSYGANSKSSIFYSRIKGELENAVQVLKFHKTTIFNPGMLQRKNTDRSGEVVMEKVLRFINTLGLFRKHKPLSTEVLAQAMINATKNQINSYDVIKLNDIHTLGGNSK